MASKDEAFASQTAESAFSLDGYIHADSISDFMQSKLKPLRFREDTADSSIRVGSGSVGGYSDLASASANGVTASQQIGCSHGRANPDTVRVCIVDGIALPRPDQDLQRKGEYHCGWQHKRVQLPATRATMALPRQIRQVI